MTDTAQETQVVVEEAAPEIEATEAVEQQVAPTEDVALETGTPGDEAQQALSPKREARKLVQEDARARQETRQKQEQEAAAEDVTEAVEPEAAEAAPEEAVGEEAGKEAGEEAGETGINSAGRKFDKKSGEYVTEGDEEGAEGEVAAEAVATEEAPKAEGEPIEVPIPSDHFVREMGQATLTAKNPEQEQVIRALVNGTYERVKAVEERDAIIAGLRTKNMELQQKVVRREASEAAMGKFEGTEAYKAHSATFETLKAAEAEGNLPAGTASAFWGSGAVQQDVKPLEDAEYTQRMGEVEAQAEQEAGQLFIGDALRAAQSALPPAVTELAAFKEVFDATISSFDAEFNAEYEAALRAGREPPVQNPEQVHKKFSEQLRDRLILNGNVRRVLNAKLEESERATKTKQRAADQRQAADKAATSREKAAAAKAVADAKREAANKRLQTPTHPLGQLEGAQRGAGEPGPTGSPSQEGPNLDDMPVHQLKRHHKRLAREDSSRRYAQRTGGP